VKLRSTSKSSAENKLQEALKEITEQVRHSELTPITHFSTIAELWIAEIEREAKLGDRSPNTVRLFVPSAGWCEENSRTSSH
jgi:hypothetical protein